MRGMAASSKSLDRASLTRAQTRAPRMNRKKTVHRKRFIGRAIRAPSRGTRE
jgi:hypothetical protein